MWRDRDGGALFRTSYAEASSEYAVLERGWVYDSGSDMTVYFDMVNGFPAFTGNWTFVPNIAKPCHMQAQGVDGNLLYFKGDTRNLADPETDRYMLLPPAGVSATTGAYAKPEDLGENDYTDRGTMWLWSGYLYVTPQVGHDVNGTTYGAQSGTNKVGSYHCWNRVYEPATGRWTTPDPAMLPWANLFSYGNNRPITETDSSGLNPAGGGAAAYRGSSTPLRGLVPPASKHPGLTGRNEDPSTGLMEGYQHYYYFSGAPGKTVVQTVHAVTHLNCDDKYYMWRENHYAEWFKIGTANGRGNSDFDQHSFIFGGTEAHQADDLFFQQTGERCERITVDFYQYFRASYGWVSSSAHSGGGTFGYVLSWTANSTQSSFSQTAWYFTTASSSTGVSRLPMGGQYAPPATSSAPVMGAAHMYGPALTAWHKYHAEWKKLPPWSLDRPSVMYSDSGGYR
ncbi:MAG: hypothetical protein IPK87_00035 [Planctomycetes bacterium]|nr:hypothetical protein [Planctomycetota bacterium]